MPIHEFIKKLQGLSDTKKKVILFAVVIIAGVIMGGFWVKSTVNNLSKIGKSLQGINLPNIDLKDNRPNVPSISEMISDSGMTDVVSEGNANIINSNLQTAGWKTYMNTEYGFEFKYPKEIAIQGKIDSITVFDTSDNYTVNWDMKFYHNTQKTLEDWIKKYVNQTLTANKDCTIFAANQYGPKVTIKDAYTLLVTNTSDVNQSCKDGGYYTISPDNKTIVYFVITQASSGHLEDMLSTFKFTD